MEGILKKGHGGNRWCKRDSKWRREKNRGKDKTVNMHEGDNII